jgi:hypothetical protein
VRLTGASQRLSQPVYVNPARRPRGSSRFVHIYSHSVVARAAADF